MSKARITGAISSTWKPPAVCFFRQMDEPNHRDFDLWYERILDEKWWKVKTNSASGEIMLYHLI